MGSKGQRRTDSEEGTNDEANSKTLDDGRGIEQLDNRKRGKAGNSKERKRRDMLSRRHLYCIVFGEQSIWSEQPKRIGLREWSVGRGEIKKTISTAAREVRRCVLQGDVTALSFVCRRWVVGRWVREKGNKHNRQQGRQNGKHHMDMRGMRIEKRGVNGSISESGTISVG